MNIKSILIITAAVVSTTGLGYVVFKHLKKTKSSVKPTATTNVVNEDVVSNTPQNKEVDEMSAINRQHFYAVCKNLSEITVSAEFFDKEESASILKITSFGDDLKLGEAKQFFDPNNKVAGFIVHTRHGNVVVWQYTEKDGDTYRLVAPTRLESVLPDFIGANYNHYVNIGNIVEKLAAEEEG